MLGSRMYPSKSNMVHTCFLQLTNPPLESEARAAIATATDPYVLQVKVIIS